MSLFTSFNSGVSGLHSAQSGLNTTAHNLANTKTKGYTRQQNINVDSYYQTIKIGLDGSSLRVGMGTRVSDIRQIRDAFLDKEYRLAIGRQSFYEKLVETESEIEDIFGETEGVEFQWELEKIWDVLQDLSENPEEIANRKLFISTSESFLESAQNIFNSLQMYQISLNTEIQEQVDTINELGEKIAFYNAKIAAAEASNQENANDYRDVRNLLLDELGKYTNYTYGEDYNGSVQIYINNALFVDGALNFHMGCEKITTEEVNPDTGKKEVTSVSEMYKVVWLDNGCGDVYNLSEAYSTEKKTDVGSLLGILTARGRDVFHYTDIPVEPKQEDFVDANGNPDETAYKIALNQFKDDLKVYNNTTANSIITKIQAQFDMLIHGIVTAINDAFSPNIDAELSQVTGKTADGKDITLDGTYRILDVINCPVGTDDAETIGTEVFSRKQIDRYQIITLDQQIYSTDAEGNQIGLARDNGDGTYSLYVYNEENPDDIDTMYTLQSLKINPELAAEYSLLPLHGNPELGAAGTYNFEFLQDLLTKWDENFAVLDPNNLASYNFNDYYKNMIGDLGTQGSIWQEMVEHQTSLTEGIEDKRQQIAGVSTDEELVSLLMYQHAYNAASRYITTVDAMLQHLIERLG
ncbi:MAG: flagellar hook-associated protein FlgK [Lachnospiraceae bacterium]|nr:flagellar hook-associated protein FlgK [Lachnospiraceae bacterium]